MATPEQPLQARPVLRTRRLDLRPLAPGDVTGFHRVCDDPAVRRHLFDDEPVSVETAGAMIGRSERDFAGGGVGLFGIRRRDTVGLIGFCGFFVAEGVGEPELAYALLPSCWGRGFATEAALAVAGYALDVAGFHRVLVATDRANAASARIIERLGARPLGKVAPGFPGVVYYEIGPAAPRTGAAGRVDPERGGVRDGDGHRDGRHLRVL
jgi:[ribosomal protein S5]-alanine N-acetyltransferase